MREPARPANITLDPADHALTLRVRSVTAGQRERWADQNAEETA